MTDSKDDRPAGRGSSSGPRRSSTRAARMTATHRVRGVEESPEIRETLEHIGELMRLPPKRPTVATQAAEVPEVEKSKKMGKGMMERP